MSRKSKKKTIAHKQNNFFADGISPALFSSAYKTYNQTTTTDVITKGIVSYSLAMSIANSNTVLSRFILMVSEAMNFLSVTNQNGDEVNSPLSRKMLGEAGRLFGHEGDYTEYVYQSVQTLLCCGMKIVAPTYTDQSGHAARIEVIDTRQVTIVDNKDMTLSIMYGGNKLGSYYRTIAKPNINRKYYGDCLFSGAVKEAILDTAISSTGIFFYQNKADPSIIYMLEGRVGAEGGSRTEAERFERILKEKYQSPEKAGLPLSSTIIKDVKIIDASPAIIGSIESRLYNSKQLGMQLGVDIRGLGYMRDGGSQAELLAVYDQLNTAIQRRSERLSKSLTNEFRALVADTGGLSFKFNPTFFRSQQQIIDNAIKAHKQAILETDYVKTLLLNQ